MGAINTALSKSEVIKTEKTTEKKCWWKKGKKRKTVQISTEVQNGVSQVHKNITKEYKSKNYSRYEKTEVKIIKSDSKNDKSVQENSLFIPCGRANKNQCHCGDKDPDCELSEEKQDEKHPFVIAVEESGNVFSCYGTYSKNDENYKATEKPSFDHSEHCKHIRPSKIAKIKPNTLSMEHHTNYTGSLNQSVLSDVFENNSWTLLESESKACICDCETYVKQTEIDANFQYAQTQFIKPLKEINDGEEYWRSSGNKWSSSMRDLKTIDSDWEEESDYYATSEKEFSSSYPNSDIYNSGSSHVLPHPSDDYISVSDEENVLYGEITCSSLKQTHKLSKEHCMQSVVDSDIALNNQDSSFSLFLDSKHINDSNNAVLKAEANAAKEVIESTGGFEPQFDSSEIHTEKCVMDTKKTDADDQLEKVESSDSSEERLNFFNFSCAIYTCILHVQFKQKLSSSQSNCLMKYQYYNSEIADLNNYLMGMMMYKQKLSSSQSNCLMNNYLMGMMVYIYSRLYVMKEMLDFEVTECENDQITSDLAQAEHPEGKCHNNKHVSRFSEAESRQKTVTYTCKSVVNVDCAYKPAYLVAVSENDLEKSDSDTKHPVNADIEDEINGSTNIMGMLRESDKDPESNDSEINSREETDRIFSGADSVEIKNYGCLEADDWNIKESENVINNTEHSVTSLKLSESVVKESEEKFVDKSIRISNGITKCRHELSTESTCQTASSLKSKSLIMKSCKDIYKLDPVLQNMNKNKKLTQREVEKCISTFKIQSERKFSVANSDQECIDYTDKFKSSLVPQTFGQEKTIHDYRNEGKAKEKIVTKNNLNRKKMRAFRVGSTRRLERDKDYGVWGKQQKHSENWANIASLQLGGNPLCTNTKPNILSKKAVNKRKIPWKSKCRIRKKQNIFKRRRKKYIFSNDDTDKSYTSAKDSVAVSTAKFCQNCHHSKNKRHKACSGCCPVRSELESKNLQCRIAVNNDSGISSLLTSVRSFILSEMESIKSYTFAGRKKTRKNTLRRFLKLGLLERDLKNITKGINTDWLARIDHDIVAIPGLQSYFNSIRNGVTLSLRERMAYEWLRLMSFSSYNGGGCPVHLAHGGFYHDHNNETRCFSCDISYSNWQYTDDVQAVHRRISPNCPLVKEGTDSNGNISIEAGSTENQSSLAATNMATSSSQQSAFAQSAGNTERQDRSYGEFSFSATSTTPARPTFSTSGADVTSRLGAQTIQQSAGAQQPADEPVPENPVRVPTQPSQIPRQTDGDAQLTVSAQHQPEGSGRQQNAAGNQGASGSSTTRQPENADNIQLGQLKHPRYSSIAVRMSSFASWPSYLNQTPRQMAYAGFFHPGVADFARCFCCGGGLRNWEADDDPMVEHARWYPKCEYVNKLKGPHFIQAVLRRHREHMAERQREQEAVETSFTSPDPMTTDVAAGLLEMGFTRDRAREAILTVRRLRGRAAVSIEEVTAWMLDDDGESNRAGGQEDIAGTGQRSEQQREPSPPNSASGSIESSATTQGASSDSQRSTEEPQGATGGGEQQVEDKGAKDKLDSSSADESSRSKEDKSSSSKKSKSKKDKKSKTKKAHSPSASHGDIDTKSLKEENKQLKQMQVCKICMDQYVSVTFLPCGHLVCCDGCARNMRKCPICRKRIKGQVKTFMS